MNDKTGIYGALEQRWQSLGDAPALSEGETELGYAGVATEVARLARHLAARNMCQGDRVILLFPNGIAQVLASLACFSLGLIAVPLTLPTGRERLRHIVSDAEPALCISAEAMPELEGVPLLQWPGGDENGQVAEPEQVRIEPKDAAMLLYSSGSTGQPKGVVISHGQQMRIAEHLANAVELAPGDRELLIAPASHSDGWQRIMAVLVCGGHLIFSDGMLSIHAILDVLVEQKIRSLFLHPTLVRYLLKMAPERVRPALAGCSTLETGSASLLADEMARLRGLLPESTRLFVHYGISESPRSTLGEIGALSDKLGSVGKAVAGVEIAIVDEEGQPLPDGATGEIAIRGEHLAPAYWRKAELYRQRIRNGWLHTGDFGRLDADGHLTFIGRRDDQIHSAGFSFYPAEVESELGALPDVVEYVVLGMPDPKGIIGDEVWFFVVPEDATNWSQRTLYALARERLERYMMPRRVIVVDEIPKTESGKPHRAQLAAHYAPDGSAPKPGALQSG
jgi:long-chain acyl-CoA synthetase